MIDDAQPKASGQPTASRIQTVYIISHLNRCFSSSPDVMQNFSAGNVQLQFCALHRQCRSISLKLDVNHFTRLASTFIYLATYIC